MNENINIAGILKDAPKGTKLWSPMFGEVRLVHVRYADTSAELDHQYDCSEDYCIKCEFVSTKNAYLANLEQTHLAGYVDATNVLVSCFLPKTAETGQRLRHLGSISTLSHSKKYC